MCETKYIFLYKREYIPSISMASHLHTWPKAPSPKMLKNFNRCLGNSHRSDFICEFAVELLVDNCDVAYMWVESTTTTTIFLYEIERKIYFCLIKFTITKKKEIYIFLFDCIFFFVFMCVRFYWMYFYW